MHHHPDPLCTLRVRACAHISMWRVPAYEVFKSVYLKIYKSGNTKSVLEREKARLGIEMVLEKGTGG